MLEKKERESQFIFVQSTFEEVLNFYLPKNVHHKMPTAEKDSRTVDNSFAINELTASSFNV